MAQSVPTLQPSITMFTQDILPSVSSREEMSWALHKINLLMTLLAVILVILFLLFVVCFIMLVQLYREQLRHKRSQVRCDDCDQRDLQLQRHRIPPRPNPPRSSPPSIWTISGGREPIYEDIERAKPRPPVTDKPGSVRELDSSVIYSVITTAEAAKFRPVADINIIR